MALTEKVALVAGASRPIGRAIARYLNDKGIHLILPYFDWPESNAEMIAEFKEKDNKVLPFPADLTESTDVEKLFQEIKRQFGKLHYLVNNIERGGMPIMHGSYDRSWNKAQWDMEIGTTLKAKWYLFHYGLPLLKQADGGAVVNISSIAAHTGRSGPVAMLFPDGYSAANRAISSFTETWAREAAPDIRVNEIMLGLISSRHGEETQGWKRLTAAEKKEIFDHILLKCTGTPEEVAQLVFFLLHEATYMTGSVIRMDGGYLLGGERSGPMPPGILERRKKD